MWRVERDLTEYASHLVTARDGYTGTNWDNADVAEGPTTITGTARIKFYPATARTPAPRIAHGVYPVNQPLTLPRNIVRAYVDVIAQGTFGDRFWYTCVPSASMAAFPSLLTPWGIGDTQGGLGPPLVGCRGGSFRQVEVLVDGQPAGIAQVYPWLPSQIRRHGRVELDLPAPSVQALNFMPYRVDLTPFAGLLSDGTEHMIELRASAGGDTGFELSIEGNLLVYRDPATAQVTGAITRNTLTLPLLPAVSNTLALSGDVVQGVVDTRLDRRYAIEGYVDTAKGRVRSSRARRTSSSATPRTSGRRALGDLPQHPRLRAASAHGKHGGPRQPAPARRRAAQRGPRAHRLPAGVGPRRHRRDVNDDEIVYLTFDQLDVTVNQARIKRGDQYRQGVPRYRSKLVDRFTGSFELAGAFPRISNQRSARSYLFKDSRGSCYSARLTTVQFEPTSYHAGGACPDGVNRVRWFAHPDGSPDNLGWTLPLPL